MRIVAGQFKGRPLKTPEGRGTRPTSDRARETVFNILTHAPWAPSLQGIWVMDLFAGSGALGLEALSRGAARCLFVDAARAATTAISANVKLLKTEAITDIWRRSALRLGVNPGAQAYDIVFIDPPYNKGLVLPALAVLQAGNWVTEGALAVVETGHEEILDLASEVHPGEGANWTCLETRLVGAAKIWFLQLDASETPAS